MFYIKMVFCFSMNEWTGDIAQPERVMYFMVSTYLGGRRPVNVMVPGTIEIY